MSIDYEAYKHNYRSSNPSYVPPIPLSQMIEELSDDLVNINQIDLIPDFTTAYDPLIAVPRLLNQRLWMDKVIGKGAYGIVSKLTFYGETTNLRNKAVIKYFNQGTPQRPRDLNDPGTRNAVVECLNLKTIANLAEEYESFPQFYGVTKVPRPITVENKTIFFNTPLSNENNPYDHYHLFSEYIPGDIYYEFKGETRSFHLEILSHLSAALAIAYERYAFTHYDLKGNNIILKKVEPQLITYRLQDRSYALPCSGYLPVIIDYGFSYTRVNNEAVTIESSYSPLSNIYPFAYPIHDINFMIHTIGILDRNLAIELLSFFVTDIPPNPAIDTRYLAYYPELSGINYEDFLIFVLELKERSSSEYRIIPRNINLSDRRTFNPYTFEQIIQFDFNNNETRAFEIETDTLRQIKTNLTLLEFQLEDRWNELGEFTKFNIYLGIYSLYKWKWSLKFSQEEVEELVNIFNLGGNLLTSLSSEERSELTAINRSLNKIKDLAKIMIGFVGNYALRNNLEIWDNFSVFLELFYSLREHVTYKRIERTIEEDNSPLRDPRSLSPKNRSIELTKRLR